MRGPRQRQTVERRPVGADLIRRCATMERLLGGDCKKALEKRGLYKGRLQPPGASVGGFAQEALPFLRPANWYSRRIRQKRRILGQPPRGREESEHGGPYGQRQNQRIINHGQRPWYWEGPPRDRLREVAPIGGVELERSRFLPGTDRSFSVDDEFQAHPMSCESLAKP